MKKRNYLLLIPLILTLSACQSTSSQGEKTDTNKSTGSLPMKKTPIGQKNKPVKVTNNGSYYSVEGKYGSVIIVNKRHPLDKHYNPGEDAKAKKAFLQVIAEMKNQGFSVSDQYSGFRSYDTQTELYQNYVNRDGKAQADRYSARPGYSEHQSGLAFDILDGQGNLLEEPQASQWLLEHAPDYGFILRYLPNKEASTGYQAESWHIRYVGKEAKDIAKSGKTLEEYYGVPGGDYPN
ncbi:LD-carboxypeptidase LdcB/DacB [Streptococcus hongkongensis]|nr:D-alanyl-D-alanine carboxypeptidase [Streptococcus uberis]